MLTQVTPYVPISAVFEDVVFSFSEFRRLLAQLSRTDALFWCARINLILSNPTLDSRVKQQYCLDMLLCEEEIHRVNRFASQHGGADRIVVFSRAQMLELIRWVCLFCQDHPNDGTTFEDSEVRRTFAKVSFMASDIWSRLYGDRFSTEGDLSTAQRRAISAMRQGIAANVLSMEMQRPVSRGLHIYQQHFRQRYPRFDILFQTATHMSLDEYFRSMCLLLTHFYNIDVEKVQQDAIFAGGFNVNDLGDKILPAARELFQKYVEIESQTSDQLRRAVWGDQADLVALETTGAFDYKPLREAPILRASDGRCIILDPVFYAERALMAPLFMLKDLGENFNQLFGAFGDAFEDYACTILRTMYPKPESTFLVDQLACDLKGPCRTPAIEGSGKLKKTEVQVDACLNQGVNVVFFEMKAALIREDKVAHEDHREYLNLLRQKYGVTAGGPKDRGVKGVGQLARAIERLAMGEWSPDGQDFQMARKLFPVLVVNDDLLLTPGHASFLAEEFASALGPALTHSNQDMQKGQFRVVPLILITIDDLENLERAIERFALIDLLNDYSAASPDRAFTLRDFVSQSERYRFVHSGSMASAMIGLLKQTQMMAFGGPEIADEPPS